MSKDRNHSICVNISNLTPKEGDKLSAAISKAKRRYAPKARVAEFSGPSSEIGNYMQTPQIEKPDTPKRKLLGWF